MKDSNQNLSDKDTESKPVGTGIGAASGAATGAAMGAAGGPVGALVGGAAGAITGGVMGSGIAHAVDHAIDPEAHDAYWQQNHASQSYASGGGYDQYRNAYKTGYTGAQEHGATKTFADAESTLKSSYEKTADNTGLGWDKAKHATQAAYDKAAKDIQIVLHEEQLRVGKREVSGGDVQIHKTVHTEQVNVPVELNRENVTIERIAAGDVRDANTADAFTEQTIEMQMTREEAVVSKESHVTGAVRVAKTAHVETQTVSDSVRKEDVEVVRDGQTEVAPKTTDKSSR